MPHNRTRDRDMISDFVISSCHVARLIHDVIPVTSAWHYMPPRGYSPFYNDDDPSKFNKCSAKSLHNPSTFTSCFLSLKKKKQQQFFQWSECLIWQTDFEFKLNAGSGSNHRMHQPSQVAGWLTTSPPQFTAAQHFPMCYINKPHI